STCQQPPPPHPSLRGAKRRGNPEDLPQQPTPYHSEGSEESPKKKCRAPRHSSARSAGHKRTNDTGKNAMAEAATTCPQDAKYPADSMRSLRSFAANSPNVSPSGNEGQPD